LLRPEDVAATVHPQRIQDVPLSMFDVLEAGDILFIDSSHVAKGGSDVCHEIFENPSSSRCGNVDLGKRHTCCAHCWLAPSFTESCCSGISCTGSMVM